MYSMINKIAIEGLCWESFNREQLRYLLIVLQVKLVKNKKEYLLVFFMR
jgi:hypothetical protein